MIFFANEKNKQTGIFSFLTFISLFETLFPTRQHFFKQKFLKKIIFFSEFKMIYKRLSSASHLCCMHLFKHDGIQSCSKGPAKAD